MFKIYDPYLYAGKFDTPSRRGKATVSGNTVYCSISNFRNYANYKCFFAFQHDGNVEEDTNPVATGSYTRYIKTNSGIGVNVRTGPGTNYSRTTAFPDGTSVTVYETSNNWSRTNYGWIYSDYLVEIYNDTIAGVTFSPYNVKVTANIGLNIRTGASISYSNIGAYGKGKTVKIIAQSGNWGKTSDGWICLDYTEKTTSNSALRQTKKFKTNTTIYANSNMRGVYYSYLPNTSVSILENISSNIDKIKVLATGRIGYVYTNVYK